MVLPLDEGSIPSASTRCLPKIKKAGAVIAGSAYNSLFRLGKCYKRVFSEKNVCWNSLNKADGGTGAFLD